MELQDLQDYLYAHIPLSEAMGVEVVEAGSAGVRLSAPLAPNINHRDTVFGGSASAVAILAAWTLLYVRLEQDGIDSRVVIQKNVMQYERPIAGRFVASAGCPAPAEWQRFLTILRRRKRARISVSVMLDCDGERVGRLDGDFAAFSIQEKRNYAGVDHE